jgi:DNA-directed RNA polymerase specialized sigma24 family protein
VAGRGLAAQCSLPGTTSLTKGYGAGGTILRRRPEFSVAIAPARRSRKLGRIALRPDRRPLQSPAGAFPKGRFHEAAGQFGVTMDGTSSQSQHPLGRAASPSLFPITEWGVVAGADHARTTTRRRTLDAIVRQYAPALRAYLVARRGVTPDAADDLLQGFLAAKVLEQEIVRRAAPERGRFRAFLVTALDRYALDEFDKAAAAKRSPARAPAPLHAVAEPQHPGRRVADVFDVEWARQVVGLAVEHVRAECEAGGRDVVWGVFEARVLAPTLDGVDPPPYEELVARFGLASVEQAANVLTTGKRMFARTLRAVVAEYADDEEDAEEEVRRLKRILAGGRA